MTKLYVDFPIPATVREFLLTFLTKSISIYVCYGDATYFDKECKLIHCEANKYRGFDDILKVVQTYFPDIDEKQLMHHLILLKYGNKYDPNFGSCYSAGILRYVLCIESQTTTDIFRKYKPENSKYNWYDLFLLLDIHNVQEMKTYIQTHKEEI